MNMKVIYYKVIPLFILIVLLSSCGSTQLLVDNKDVSIYVDGENLGKGSAEIRRTGIPKKINITAKYQSKEVGSLQLKRKFDLVTFITGYFTYGIGFIFAWRFPAVVTIPTNELDKSRKSKSIWLEPPGSGNW